MPLCQVAVSGTQGSQRALALNSGSDVLIDGRQLRTLNMLDDYNRQHLGVETGFSLPAKSRGANADASS